MCVSECVCAPNLSVDPEGACLLVQFDGGDARNLPGLLDVVAVATDGQAHQVHPDGELFLAGRRQLLGTLGNRGGTTH